jgi:hypothetical protein
MNLLIFCFMKFTSKLEYVSEFQQSLYFTMIRIVTCPLVSVRLAMLGKGWALPARFA